MARDQVFSPESVSATLKGGDASIPVDLRIYDPPYEYSHEDPIPRRMETPQAGTGGPEEFLDALSGQVKNFFQTY
jgi:hypothetical protein